eukprot:363837-Chlamydomonas_euryale.AAC.3
MCTQPPGPAGSVGSHLSRECGAGRPQDQGRGRRWRTATKGHCAPRCSWAFVVQLSRMLQAFRAVGGLAAVLPRASAPGLAYLSTSYVHHHHPCMLHQHHHHHQQQQQQQQQQQRIGDAAVGRSFSTVPNQIALIKALREKSGAPISDIKARGHHRGRSSPWHDHA